ncbi:MAG: hypothetical protein PHG07_08855 [Lachnospiraceae bacterium]|jgi:hypothetical protein|nr:hypothetical protein [Lachnospiraceae bacterium]
MKNNKKNLEKKEIEFSESYKRRKAKLLQQLLKGENYVKKESSHRKKPDDIL